MISNYFQWSGQVYNPLYYQYFLYLGSFVKNGANRQQMAAKKQDIMNL
jgi:hypothetical protein